MPFFLPNTDLLCEMFGFSEPVVLSEVWSAWTGKSVLTERTARNWLQRKHKPNSPPSTLLAKFGIEPQKIEWVKKMEGRMGKSFDKYRNHHLVYYKEGAIGLRSSGMLYFSDILEDIVNRESRCIAACKNHCFQEEITRDELAREILSTDEMVLLQQATGEGIFGPVLVPLPLKTVLYALTAYEVEGLRCAEISVEKFLNISGRIVGNEKNPMGEFFQILSKSICKNHTEFTQKYIVYNSIGEDSAVKKFRRWRQGKAVPDSQTVLKILNKISDDVGAGTRPDILLFLLAKFFASMAEINPRMKLPIEWAKEYRRFRNIHIAQMKKRGQSD